MTGENICHIYEEISQWYDRVRGRELMERPYLDQALAHCSESPAILDLGCGTGEPIARYLIEKKSTLHWSGCFHEYARPVQGEISTHKLYTLRYAHAKDQTKI